METMTTNAFLMMWDCYGIEAVIPITQYEDFEVENSLRILAGEKPIKNPINDIVNAAKMRAKFNSQRNYEIYAIDCDKSFTMEGWIDTWNDEPQATANLIRERGIKIYSDRKTPNDPKVVIT